jgi:Flp pilus assembly protein TadG
VSERGLAESTQWALVLPTLLALILGLVQLGIWLHGRTVAAEAASAAADLRAAGPAAAAEAERVARAIATRGGLLDVAVTTVQGPTTVTVTVAGRVPALLDLGHGPVAEHAVLPLERTTRP